MSRQRLLTIEGVGNCARNRLTRTVGTMMTTPVYGISLSTPQPFIHTA